MCITKLESKIKNNRVNQAQTTLGKMGKEIQVMVLLL